LPAGWAAPLSSSTPWRFCFAPRARSGRLGCASSAALRPACACDPALGGKRPASGPLAVRRRPRQRYPTARRPLGSRTLRRDGSFRPRGGFHPHPRPQAKRSRDPGTECSASMSLAEGWGVQSPGGWGGHLSGGCRVAAGGVSERRERGRASAERPLTRRATEPRGERQETGVRGKAPRKRHSLGKCSTLTLIAGGPVPPPAGLSPPEPPSLRGSESRSASFCGGSRGPPISSQPTADRSQLTIPLLTPGPHVAAGHDPATGLQPAELPYDPQTLTPTDSPIVLGRMSPNPNAPLGRAPAAATPVTPLSFVRFFP